MERRIVRPFKKVSWTMYALFGGMALLILAQDIVLWRLADSFDFEPSPSLVLIGISPLLLMIGVIVHMHVTSGKREWHFTDEAFMPNRGPLSFSATSIPWSAVSLVKLEPRGPFGTKGEPFLRILLDPAFQRSQVYMRLDAFNPEAVPQILAELLAHVPAERIDPALVVTEDLVRLVQHCESLGGDCLGAATTKLRAMKLSAAAPILKQHIALDLGGANQQLLMLAASQVFYLIGDYKQALAVTEQMRQHHPESIGQILVEALSAKQLGDDARAARGLGRISRALRQPVIDSANMRTGRGENVVPKPALASPLITALMSTLIVTWIVFRLIGDEDTLALLPPWTKYVAVGALAVFLIAMFGLFAIEIVKRARSARSVPVHPATPSQMPLPGSPGDAAANDVRVVRLARAILWVSIVGFMVAVIALVGTQLLSLFAPEVLAGESGEWASKGKFMTWAIGVVFVSMMLFIRAVRMGALTRIAPKDPAEAQVLAQVIGEPVAQGSALNVSLPTGWVVAALGVGVGCAAVAVGLSAWDVPAADWVTSDANGSVYAQFGDEIRVADKSGATSVFTNVRATGVKLRTVTDMKIGPTGTLYLADAGKGIVHVFDGRGALVTSLEPIPGAADLGETQLSVAPHNNGAVILENGVLFDVGRDNAMTPRAKLPEKYELWYAQGLAASPDGGTLYLGDTSAGRILRIRGNAVDEFDCLAFPGGYRYPDTLSLGPGGLYAVLRKPWEYDGGPGRPLSTLRRPNIWMGQLYRIDFDAHKADRVDVGSNGTNLNVNNVTPLPDGTVVVQALNGGWLYRMDAARPQAAAKMSQGEFGELLARTDIQWRLAFSGPQIFFGLAIILPLILGVAGVFAARRKMTQPLLPQPQPT